MKTKCFCPRCGRFITIGSLKKSLFNHEMICPVCFTTENSQRNKTDYQPEINGLTNSFKKELSSVRMAKIGKLTNKFTTDEIQFLKTKYNSDSFVTGKKEVGELKRLKDGLVKVKKPTSKTKPLSKSKNKFLEGLK